MKFLKKFIKNKMLVLSICVIIVSLVYMGIQKAIDNYNFEHNNDIVSEEQTVTKEEKERSKSDNSNSSEDLDQNVENLEDKTEEDGIIANEEIDLVLEEEEIQETNKETINETQNKIYVYITGEVNNPGVVVLNEGSRIVDAINAAGGTTPKADISKVNLVYVLDDGMKVNIPNNSDLKNDADFEYITMNSGDGRKEETPPKDTETNNSKTSSNYSKKYDVVNINTATQTELETLPGIGPSLALKIINYRKENGKFSSIEQIKDVSGIGESKYENLKNYITI